MSPSEDAEPWFVATVPRSGATARAYGFPNVGGGVSSLTTMAEHMPAGVELRTANLPGRQARIDDDPRTDLDGLIDDLARAVVDDDGLPFVLYGDCSGSLFAWLVAMRLQDSGRPLPVGLVLASLEAPDRLRLPGSVEELPRDEFWELMVDLGGLPAELAEDEDFRDLLEPALRADFGMVRSFTPVPVAPLPVPFTLLIGERDRRIEDADVAGWRALTSAGLTTVRVPGCSHWIARDNPAEAARLVAAAASGG